MNRMGHSLLGLLVAAGLCAVTPQVPPCGRGVDKTATNGSVVLTQAKEKNQGK